MYFKNGTELRNEIYAIPQSKDIDPEGVVLLQAKFLGDPENSDTFVKDFDVKITQDKKEPVSYSDFCGQDFEIGTRTCRKYRTEVNDKTKRRCFNLYWEPATVADNNVDNPFGVIIFGKIQELNSIIALDVCYTIGNRKTQLHIPIEVHLSEDKSTTIMSLTYDIPALVGGCAAYLNKDVPEISVVSDYESKKIHDREVQKEEDRFKANKLIGKAYKKKNPKENRSLFVKSKLFNGTDDVDVYCLTAPEEYSYRLPLCGVRDEELSLF